MEVVGQYRWWQQLENVRYLLYGCFFFFMPFTQALTFNIGFPLKFSEIALLALAVLYLGFNRRISIPKPIIFIISAFFFLVTLSLLVNLFWHYPYTLKTYESRFGYVGDSVSRYIYFILALLAFVISIDIYLTSASKFIKVWIYGAIVAALYGWYLALFSFLKMPVYLIPGMKDVPQTIYNGIIRSGTFAEGNFMGLFLFLSGVMSFYTKRIKTGIFFFISVFSTFSTLSILSTFIWLGFYLKDFFLRKRYLPYFIFLLVLSIPSLGFFTHTEVYQHYVYDKLFSGSKQITNEGSFSKIDRLNSARVAYRMAQHNIFLGVGPSNYGRHYDHYHKRGDLTEIDYKTLRRPNNKTIPNNIYMEIWSEYGTLALSIFLIFLFTLLNYARKYSANILFPAILCLSLCFVAYPSFIMIYIWAWMALPVANFIYNRQIE